MRVLDLFSGIGGFSLGLERAGMKTVAFCEIDPFCQKVLKKHWPGVPIYKDVRELEYDGSVDLICGGYPCQPFSAAGKRKGAEDDRHLWPAMFSLIKKYRPSWVIGENVAGHISMGLDAVLTDLESENYTARTFVIPACAVNAPHRRDRTWIVAYAERGADKQQCENAEKRGRTEEAQQARMGASKKNDANTERKRRCKGLTKGALPRQRNHEVEFERIFEVFGAGPDLSQPLTCGNHDGISNVPHRLRALGNAVVPQIPEIIGRSIMEAHHER